MSVRRLTLLYYTLQTLEGKKDGEKCMWRFGNGNCVMGGWSNVCRPSYNARSRTARALHAIRPVLLGAHAACRRLVTHVLSLFLSLYNNQDTRVSKGLSSCCTLFVGRQTWIYFLKMMMLLVLEFIIMLLLCLSSDNAHELQRWSPIGIPDRRKPRKDRKSHHVCVRGWLPVRIDVCDAFFSLLGMQLTRHILV